MYMYYSDNKKYIFYRPRNGKSPNLPTYVCNALYTQLRNTDLRKNGILNFYFADDILITDAIFSIIFPDNK